jgi:hypothetical protein
VHGANIQPFGYQDRVDFLVSLDAAIDTINLDNIELLAVEEFLPASGPSAESLMNLFGTSTVFKSPQPSSRSGAPAPPPSGDSFIHHPRAPESPNSAKELCTFACVLIAPLAC